MSSARAVFFFLYRIGCAPCGGEENVLHIAELTFTQENGNWREKMKKAVFFDIDGTLWNEHMQVPESTTEAIRELRADGNYAFLCSGRSRSNIRSEKILGIGFDGIVAACGTHIEYEGKKVCERLLTPEEAEELLRVIEAYHMEAVLEGPHYIYANGEDFKEDPFIAVPLQGTGRGCAGDPRADGV